MSKSGSRYGRRSNWFKIHCILQEKQQQEALQHYRQRSTPPPALNMLGQRLDPRLQHQLATALQCRTKEDLLLLGVDEYKNSTSPSISSPESHNSDTSVEVSETRLLAGGGLFLNNNTKCSPEQRPSCNSKDMFMSLPITFPHHAALFPPLQHNTFLLHPSNFVYHQQPPNSHQSVLKNNIRYTHNGDVYRKRFVLDAILRSQQSPSGGTTSRDDEQEEEEETLTETMKSPKHQSGTTYSTSKPTVFTMSRISASSRHEGPEQENPMDLSMKGCQHDKLSPSPAGSADDEMTDQEEDDSEEVAGKSAGHDLEYEGVTSDNNERHSRSVATPMDLTTRA
jgi:nuclear receptor subfamily 0 group A